MKKFRKNNKGFTLVELIIVIAIIAVLSAVTAPQYIKYVEKSKAASDADTFGAVVQAVNVLVADGTISTDTDFYWDKTNGSIKIDAASGTDPEAANVLALTGAVGKPKSAKALASASALTIQVDFDANTKQPTVTVAPADYATAWAS